jgi:hypothetical protein
MCGLVDRKFVSNPERERESDQGKEKEVKRMQFLHHVSWMDRKRKKGRDPRAKKIVEEGLEKEEEGTKKPINDRNPHDRGRDAFGHRNAIPPRCKP